MDSDSEIKDRLKDIDEFISAFYQTTIHGAAKDQRDAASFAALSAIVYEIAHHLGVSPQAFQRHFEIRRHYFYEHYIAQVAKTSQKVADKLDQRSPNTAPASPNFPPLFDPPTDDRT